MGFRDYGFRAGGDGPVAGAPMLQHSSGAETQSLLLSPCLK